MGWLKVDDNFLEHPKFLEAVEKGGELVTHVWFKGLAHARKYLTDGHLTHAAVRSFSTSRRLSVAVSALSGVGLWRATDAGYVIHDYLEWYESKEEVEAKRRANSAKVKGWRGRAKPECNPVTNRSVTDVQPICNPPRSARSDSDSDTDTDKSDSEPRDVAQGAVRPFGAGLSTVGSVEVASTEPAPLADAPAPSQPPAPPSPPLSPPLPASGQPEAGDESPPSQVRRADPRATQVTEVLEHWAAKLYPARRPKFDDSRKGKVKARLADFSVDDLKLAIDGCAKSPFHTERGFKDIELICRDAKHVEMFLAIARGEVKPDGPPSRPSWGAPPVQPPAAPGDPLAWNAAPRKPYVPPPDGLAARVKVYVPPAAAGGEGKES